ncbi:MAG: class I SAM-dependent rRNA methyltransferase [Verrucomicrobiales bacterium]|jgi:23S rRNA (cytosine1962-C5)-methyltransferase|nr:class I SAM-dependent rRNA methyltransferase [Verrucomicrobiales bacterium]
MPALKLKPGDRPRVLKGHPWVFANEVQQLLPADADGRAVECRDARGRLLGTGIYNGKSQIVWRRFATGRADFDKEFLRAAIVSAARRRGDADVARLVWSESDNLPGLIADRYGDIIVLQALTLAVDRRLADIADIFDELCRPKSILLKNDAPIRVKEGLDLTVSVAGAEVTPHWRKIGEVEFWLDLAGGQKTGFYLDQREEYRRVAALCRGRRVLDACCNQGGFALHAAAGGATEVLGIDISKEAVALARRNAERNRWPQVTFSVGNVFDYFSRERRREWDVIILDPPSFTKTKGRLAEALRGYKGLNLRALQCLAPGGVLATYACSHHVTHDAYWRMLLDAAGDAGRAARLLDIRRQPADHPIVLQVPESEYLRGFILELID